MKMEEYLIMKYLNAEEYAIWAKGAESIDSDTNSMEETPREVVVVTDALEELAMRRKVSKDILEEIKTIKTLMRIHHEV